MVDQPTYTSETERLQNNIKRLREDRFNAAQRVQGDFLVEDEQVGVESARRIEDKNTAELIGGSASAGFQDTAAYAIGTDIGIRGAAGVMRYNEGDQTAKAVAEEILKLSERFDDPNWNPRVNDSQRELIEQDITELGLDIEGPEAEALMGAGSNFERSLIKEQITKSRERMSTVADAGALGITAYMAANIFDIDTLTGVGLFAKLRKVKTIKRLQKLERSGDITADEVNKLSKASSRSSNLKTGIEAGLTSALVVEGTRAVLDPTADEKDVIGAAILATTLGAGIGAALPTNRVETIADDIAFNRILKSAKKYDPIGKQRGVFNESMRFVEEAEGGFANVAGDRGGATMFGITEKYYPKQHKEVVKILKEKGDAAARRYSRNFFKNEFYNKVVTPEMSAAQAKVMFDTAVNSGTGTAKKLYKKANGNVNKFLQLREDYVRDIAAKDPSQEQFLQGWLNRINRLRDDVAGVRTKSGMTTEGQTRRNDEQSVGAASINNREEVFQTGSSQQLQDLAWDFFEENPELDAAYRGLDDFIGTGEDGFAARLSKQISEKVYKGIQQTPFISDYDRLVRDAGIVGRYLAYHTLDSPVGQIVNNRSAAATGDLMNRMAAVEYAPNAAKHFDTWAKDQGIRRVSKRYVWDGHLEFGKELQKYRETIHAGKTPDANVHPSIKAASDDLDRAYKIALDNNKKYGVEGFEDVEFISGYTPRKWRGDKFSQIEAKDGIGSARVIQALKDGIMAKTPDMDEQTAFIYAAAIRRAAKNTQLQSPVGSLMTVNAQGQAAIEQAILDMGLVQTADEAIEMARKVLYKDSERGTVKASRRRINIDMTTAIPGTDKTLLDLVDNDVYAITDRAIRGQSNHAAMASVGIQNRDREAWLRAAMDWAEQSGLDPIKAQKAVNDMFNMFGEGAFGNMDPNAGRINKLAILSFLPQLGITQIAEAGVAMGVGGIRGWTHYAGKSIPDMLKGKDPEILDSLWGVNAYAADHRLWVSTDHLDDVNLDDAPRFMRTVDRAMDKGMRGMGYISGFYKVNEFLHATAALTMNNYMVRSIRDSKNAARLATMGVDEEFASIIRNHLSNGNIKFNEQGFVSDMGVENWHPDELDLLRVVTRRNMDQTVQKARKGEAHAWQYNTVGSLFSSLKSFTFTAAQKQLVRNMRLADPEAFQMVLTTTGTAALAYAAKQIVNGNLDRLEDPEYLAKGAINWSPLLSPAMMAVDPLAFVLGADKIPGSPVPFNDWRYGSQGLISLPAGITALNQLSGLGRLPADLLEGDGLDRDSINALKALPVIGRSYPMIPIIEQLDKD